jgi:hypothetical protein
MLAAAVAGLLTVTTRLPHRTSTTFRQPYVLHLTGLSAAARLSTDKTTPQTLCLKSVAAVCAHMCCLYRGYVCTKLRYVVSWISAQQSNYSYQH